MKKSKRVSRSSRPSSASRSDLRDELLELMTERKRREDRTSLDRYAPYARQREFHAAGREHRERLLMAANQVGKTFCGAAEAAFHLTGRYPAWWQGRRWDRPVRGWAASKTAEVTRDTVQRVLIGEPKDRTAWGTGLIPGDDIRGWHVRSAAG